MALKYNLSALTLVLVALFQLSTQKTFPPLPYEVLEVMGSREMRYHHFLWHNLRELWPLITDNKTKEAIADLGWAPPRPSVDYDENFNYIAREENGSGEDFLYMHRQMVQRTNELLKKAGTDYEKVVGFPKFPAPDDPDYPVPCKYVIPGKDQIGFTELVNDIKSDEFYRREIVPTDEAFRNDSYLRGVTLGQLGARLEYTLHNWMHMRFSSKTPYGLRPIVRNPVPDIDERWDQLTYQWLADTYSSHVNPVFWRIHGYVEDRLEQWRRVNGIDEIQWNNTWTGGSNSTLDQLFEVGLQSEAHQQDIKDGTVPPDNTTGDSQGRLLQGEDDMHSMHGMHGSSSRETMEKVIKLLMDGVGKECPLYKNVIVPNPPADFIRNQGN